MWAVPEYAFFILNNAEIKLDFPAPVRPTIPIFSPIFISKFTFLRTTAVFELDQGSTVTLELRLYSENLRNFEKLNCHVIRHQKLSLK